MTQSDSKNWKFLTVTFNELELSLQQHIAKVIAEKVCKGMRTPPVSDPCADMTEATMSVLNTLQSADEVVAEIDIEELGKESNIL